MVCIAAGPMLDAAEILAFMYEVLDKLAFALSGPQLFRSAYKVGWQHFMHTTCGGMVLAGYNEKCRRALSFVEFARSKQVDRLHKGSCIWLADATYMLYDTD